MATFDENDFQSFEINTTAFSNGELIGTCELGEAEIQLLNDDNNYSDLKGEWISTSRGSFYIYDVTPVQERVNIKLNCYDIKYKLDVDYNKEDYDSLFPCDLITWRNAIANNCGLTFTDTEFPNSSYLLPSQPYTDDCTKCRDVIKKIAQASFCWVDSNESDDLFFSWVSSDEPIEIDDWLSLTTEKTSSDEINEVVLGRGDVEDIVIYPNPAPENPKEIRINNNYILDPQDINSTTDRREEMIEALYNQVVGFKYIPFTLQTQPYVCTEEINPFDIKIGTKVKYTDIWDNELESVVMSKTLTWLGGDLDDPNNWEITISAEEIEESSSDNKLVSTSKKMVDLSIKVDKNSEEIKALNSKIYNISTTKTSSGSITLDDTVESTGAIGSLIITGFTEQILYPGMAYPSDNVYPGILNSYILVGSTIVDDETTTDEYFIDLGVSLSETDELIIESNEVYTNINGVKTDTGIYLNLKTYDDNTSFYIKYFNNLSYECEYLIKNDLTTTFATQAQISSEIKISTDEVLIESKSYTDKSTDGDELIASINTTSTGNVKIKASDTIALEGYTTINGNFSVDEEGNASMNSATITGGDIYLPEGGKILGGDGILTTMTINSNIHSKSFVGGSALLPMGYSLNYENSSGNIVSVKDCLVFEFTIPKNFTPKSAYITLTHAPVKYYYCGSLSYTGYSRNLNLYKGSNLSNLYVKYEYGYYEVKPNGVSYSKIDGAFGDDGFTGSNSSLTSTTSIDLIKYLNYSKSEDTYNVFKIETSNALVTSESAIYQQSGACNATLTIIGYTTD